MPGPRPIAARDVEESLTTGPIRRSSDPSASWFAKSHARAWASSSAIAASAVGSGSDGSPGRGPNPPSPGRWARSRPTSARWKSSNTPSSSARPNQTPTAAATWCVATCHADWRSARRLPYTRFSLNERSKSSADADSPRVGGSMTELVASIPTLDPGDRLLCGPGPSNVHPQVLEAMGLPMNGHLEPDFWDILLNRVE